MGLLDGILPDGLPGLFATLENRRGQIKRRGLLDLPNILGEDLANLYAGPGLLAAEHARSVVPEVRDPAQQKMMDTATGLLGATKYVGKSADAKAYQGLHKPNLKDSGAPLHDLTKVYPDDVYGPNGLRYYGTGDPALDAEAYSIAMSAHNRPNKPVKAYRAVPHDKTPDEQLSTLYKQKAAYMSRNIVPKEWGGSKKSLGDMQGFYDWVTAEIAKLEAMPK